MFELPKLDMKLWGKIEAIDNAEAGKPKFRAMYDFVKSCLPAEYVERKLDGKTLDTIDLNSLSICAMAIRSAYNREVADARDESSAEDIEKIKEMSDAIKGIVDASKIVNK